MKTEIKKWVYSKTLWINIIALIALILQNYYGFILNPEEQAAIIIFINLILRAVTNKGLSLK